MGKREYSAGIVSKGFWFLEFKKFLGLLREGKSEIEIRKLQEEKNIFSASSKDYGKRIVGEIMKRTRAISDEIKELFFKVDVGTQKVINLLSVMQTDKLFFEYVYNSYRNDMLLGTQEYNSNAVKKFLDENNVSGKIIALNFFGASRGRKINEEVALVIIRRLSEMYKDHRIIILDSPNDRETIYNILAKAGNKNVLFFYLVERGVSLCKKSL